MFEQKLSDGNWLIFNLLNFSHIITDVPLSRIEVEKLDEETRNTLLELGFLSYFDETDYFQDKVVKWIKDFESKYDPKTENITVIITPTYCCNFRCSYCYQPALVGKESRQRMDYISNEMLEELFISINKIIPLTSNNIEIKVCGGEVFLDDSIAINFVNNLVQKTKQYQIDSLQFITNGYNIDMFFPLLKKISNILYTITLDGTEDIHNSRRYLSNGGNTFSKIISNIEQIIAESDHSVQIRINLDNHNIKTLPEYFKFLSKKGWLDSKQIGLSFNKVISYSNNTLTNNGHPKIIQSIKDSRSVIHNLLHQLYEYNVTNFNISGTIIPPLIVDLFWPRIIGKQEPSEFAEPLILLCAANQGIFGCADFQGKLYPCGYELAPNWGEYYPESSINFDSITRWNSLEHAVEKFYKQPCFNCKFLFLCNKRQCEFFQLDEFDETKQHCMGVFKELQAFFEFYGDFI